MYPFLVLLALSVPSANEVSPVWHRDYGRALRQAEAARKPMAVFIGWGANGPASVSEEGELSLEVCRLLSAYYVCVYIDAVEPAARELVDAFEAAEPPTLVLSDASRIYQAFRHSGTFDDAGLRRVLDKYRLHEEETTPQEPPEAGHCRA